MQPAMQASAAATPSRSGGGTVAIAIGALVLVGGGLVAGWMFSRADAPDRDSKRSERRDERDDDRKKDRKKDRDDRSDETGGASDASERERSEREASAASPDPQPASQPRSRPLAPTPPAAASAPAPPAPAAPAFLSSGMTCAKTKAGGCLACCTQPRMIMDADCRCLKPVCQADESPIPNHCMRVH
jgi:hypothetical protein